MVQVKSVIGGCSMPEGLPDGDYVKLIDFHNGRFEVEFEGALHKLDAPCDGPQNTNRMGSGGKQSPGVLG